MGPDANTGLNSTITTPGGGSAAASDWPQNTAIQWHLTAEKKALRPKYVECFNEINVLTFVGG